MAAHVLYIVARENPALYRHLRTTLEIATVKVIFDRRTGERRQRVDRPEVERRSAERRKRNIDEELLGMGWAEVHVEDCPMEEPRYRSGDCD